VGIGVGEQHRRGVGVVDAGQFLPRCLGGGQFLFQISNLGQQPFSSMVAPIAALASM
jgi:hypothetical protein